MNKQEIATPPWRAARNEPSINKGESTVNTKIITSLLAGAPLSALFALYFLVHGKVFVEMVTSSGDPGAQMMPQRVWYTLFLVSFVLAGLLFGVGAFFLYGKIGSPLRFRLGILTGALLLSALAVLSRTPLVWDKIIAHFAVAVTLSLLIPALWGP